MRPAPSPRMSRARQLANERRLRSDLTAQFTDNQTDLYVLNARELTGIWVNSQRFAGKSDEDLSALYESVTGYTLNAVRDHTGTVADPVLVLADWHYRLSIVEAGENLWVPNILAGAVGGFSP